MKQSTEEILCTGFGGQGIMFMGKLIAQAGLMADRNVTWMPSYGAEVRGGTAYSMTKISDEEIGDPLILRPTILIAMNRPSLLKYQSSVREGGVLIVNRSMAGEADRRKEIDIVNVPMTDMASKLGDTMVANIIAVGVLLNKQKFVTLRNVTHALEELLGSKKELLELNKRALEKGHKIGR